MIKVWFKHMFLKLYVSNSLRYAKPKRSGLSSSRCSGLRCRCPRRTLDGVRPAASVSQHCSDHFQRHYDQHWIIPDWHTWFDLIFNKK